MYTQTLGTIACILCGIQTPPNPSALCSKCLASQIDVTIGISTKEILNQCKSCSKWEISKGSAGSRWINAEYESAELLSICLHRIKGLGRGKDTESGKVVSNTKGGKGKKKKKDRKSDTILMLDTKPRLIDSKFIWTEPHSRRIKVQVVVERDVQSPSGGDMAIRQPLEVEFIINNQMCSACAKEDVGQAWRSVVQIRQNVDHKRTFYFLEQIILQRKAAAYAVSVVIVPNGIDVFFGKHDHAVKFADFIATVVPAGKRKESKQLTSSDLQNNVYNFRHAISMEIVPVCKYDLIILPPALHATIYGGSKSSLLLCNKVAGIIHLVDPENGKTGELRQAKFFSNEFRPIATFKNMIEFVILDTKIEENGKRIAECARVLDFGKNDIRSKASIQHFREDLLHTGDIVMGYNIENSNFLTDEDKIIVNSENNISVILVYKPHVKKDQKKKSKKDNKINNNTRGYIGHHSTPNEAYGISENDVEEVLQDLNELGVNDTGDDILDHPEKYAVNPISTNMNKPDIINKLESLIIEE